MPILTSEQRQIPSAFRYEQGIAQRRAPDTPEIERARDISRRIASARMDGHSDAEIAAALARKDPRVAAALADGHAPDDVFKAATVVRSGDPQQAADATRANHGTLDTGANARTARAEHAAGPQGLSRVVADARAGAAIPGIQTGNGVADFVVNRSSPIGAIRDVVNAGGALVNMANAPIQRRLQERGVPPEVTGAALNTAEAFIPLNKGVEIANLLKGGARAIAPAAADAGRLIKGLMTPASEPVTLERAMTTAKPRMVRPAMTPEADALISRAKNSATDAEIAANNQQRLADALKAHQEAAQTAAETKPVLNVGELQDKSLRGANARLDISVPHEQIIRDMQANDERLRDLQKEISDAAQAAGKSVADLPDAQKLLQESADAINPPRGTTRDVSGPLADEQRRIHSEITQALRDRQVVVSHDEALAAAAQGDVVKPIPSAEPGGEPTYVRTFKTSFDALDTLRRRLGQSFGQEMEGFSAITNDMRRGLATKIDDLLTQFVGDVHPELQANWRDGLLARAKYEEAPIGRAATELVGETNIPVTSANKLPETILGRGENGIKEYLAVSGSKDATLRFLKNELEADFENATAKTASRAVSANGRIGDVLGTLERGALGDEGKALAARVRSHVTDLQDAEQAGVRAKSLKLKAKTAQTNATSAMSARDTANKNWLDAATWRAELQHANAKQAVETGLKVNKAQMDAGLITPVEAAKRAEWLNNALAKQVHIDKIKKVVGNLLTVGAVGALGASGYLAAKGGQAANSTANLLEP